MCGRVRLDNDYSEIKIRKDSKLQYSTFNARSEEFTTKPAFKDAWKWGQRCLVVTNGFYEWKKLDPKGKIKQAYAVEMASGDEMVMAGLWSKWRDPIPRRGSGLHRPDVRAERCDG